MTTLEGLRRQLDSVTELESIVRTMKALAAVHVRQYEDAARSLAAFDETIELGFQVLLRRVAIDEIADIRRGPSRTAAVVLGTDQGMCGSFNDRLVAFVQEALECAGMNGSSAPILAVGHRTRDLLLDVQLVPEETLGTPTSLGGVTGLVEDLLVRIDAWHAADRFDRLVVLHNRRRRGSRPEPRALQHLPLSESWLRDLARRPWTGPSLPQFTLSATELLSHLIRQHLFGSLFRAVVESLESENAARLEAMHAAETNISEILVTLGDAFRKERQAVIMAELLDIVSGYEATRGAS